LNVRTSQKTQNTTAKRGKTQGDAMSRIRHFPKAGSGTQLKHYFLPTGLIPYLGFFKVEALHRDTSWVFQRKNSRRYRVFYQKTFFITEKNKATDFSEQKLPKKLLNRHF